MRRFVFGTLLLMIVGATGIAVDYMNQWRLQSYAEGAVTPETYLAALPARIETITGDVSEISLGGSQTVGSYVEGFKATLALNEDPQTGVLVNKGGGFSNKDIATRIRDGELRADGILGGNADDIGDMSPQDMYRFYKTNLMRGGMSEAVAESKAREIAETMEKMIDLESTSN